MPVCPVWLPRRSYLGNRCPGCGYDLSGSLTGRCPECGAVYDRVPGRRARGLSLRAAVRGRWVVVSGFFGVIHLLAVVGVLMYDLEQRFPAVAVFTMLLSLVSPRQSVWGFALLFALNSVLWGALLGTAWTGALLFATDLPAFFPWWPQGLRFWGAFCRECGSDIAGSRARRCPVCGARFPRFRGRNPSNADMMLTSHWRFVATVIAVIHFVVTFCLAPHFMSRLYSEAGLDFWSWVELVLAVPLGMVALMAGGCLLYPIGLAINSVLWGAVLAALYVAALGVVSSLRRRL